MSLIFVLPYVFLILTTCFDGHVTHVSFLCHLSRYICIWIQCNNCKGKLVVNVNVCLYAKKYLFTTNLRLTNYAMGKIFLHHCHYHISLVNIHETRFCTFLCFYHLNTILCSSHVFNHYFQLLFPFKLGSNWWSVWLWIRFELGEPRRRWLQCVRVSGV